jgi:hypothetical protein
VTFFFDVFLVVHKYIEAHHKAGTTFHSGGTMNMDHHLDGDAATSYCGECGKDGGVSASRVD